jgi:hypothetical protein
MTSPVAGAKPQRASEILRVISKEKTGMMPEVTSIQGEKVIAFSY